MNIYSKNAKKSEKTLFICKLNRLTEENDLKEIFEKYGNVTECKIIKDWKTGKSLNYGFIVFQSK